MIGVTLLAITVIVAAVCVALAWSHARRIGRTTGGDTAALATALKRVPEADRLTELERRTEPGSWEHALASDLLAAPSEARLAVVNEALSDMDHALRERAAWPKTALRLSLLDAGLFAFATYIADQGEIKLALAIVGIGGAAALACMEAGRSAGRRVQAARVAIDALIAVAVGPIEGPVGRSGAARRARWRGGKA